MKNVLLKKFATNVVWVLIFFFSFLSLQSTEAHTGRTRVNAIAKPSPVARVTAQKQVVRSSPEKRRTQITIPTRTKNIRTPATPRPSLRMAVREKTFPKTTHTSLQRGRTGLRVSPNPSRTSTLPFAAKRRALTMPPRASRVTPPSPAKSRARPLVPVKAAATTHAPSVSKRKTATALPSVSPSRKQAKSVSPGPQSKISPRIPVIRTTKDLTSQPRRPLGRLPNQSSAFRREPQKSVVQRLPQPAAQQQLNPLQRERTVASEPERTAAQVEMNNFLNMPFVKNSLPFLEQVKMQLGQRRTARTQLTALEQGDEAIIRNALREPDPMTALQRQDVSEALQRLNIRHRDTIVRFDVLEGSKEFPAYDLGYRGSGRSLLYRDLDLLLPKAPILHPYYIRGNHFERYASPSFPLNLKLPRFLHSFVPSPLHRHLESVDPRNIETFLIVQDTPWTRDARLALKPQAWLDPDVPTAQADYWKSFIVQTGLFSRNPNGPLFENQRAGQLIQESNLSTHSYCSNDVFNNRIVSSSDVLNINQLNRDRSQVLFSLTKYREPNGNHRVAVVKHILLTSSDMEVVEEAVKRSHTFAEFQRNIKPQRNRLGVGSIADEFDL